MHSLKDNSLVAVGKVNNHKRLYSFSHFVPKSPSSALLHTSHRVDTDTDISDSASTSSDRRGSFDSCSENSLYQSSPLAYIAIVTGLADQGPSRLSDPVSDLEDSSDALPLLDAEASSSVVHSLHDRSSQVEVSVGSHDQQLQQSSSSVAESDISLRQILSMHSGSVSSIPWSLFLPKGRNTIQHSWISFFIGAVAVRHSSFGGGASSVSLPLIILYCIYWMYVIMVGS